MYVGYIWDLRARQHLRSLAPVMNDYGWLRWPNDIRGPWGLKLPDICLTGEEKPWKKPHPGDFSRPGIQPGPAAWQARMLHHLSHSGGQNCNPLDLLDFRDINFGSVKFFRGRRVIGISGYKIWPKTLMELIFNPFGEFRWSSEGPVSQIRSSHLLVGAPGIFSDL